jgi:hypothetical protein
MRWAAWGARGIALESIRVDAECGIRGDGALLEHGGGAMVVNRFRRHVTDARSTLFARYTSPAIGSAQDIVSANRVSPIMRKIADKG